MIDKDLLTDYAEQMGEVDAARARLAELTAAAETNDDGYAAADDYRNYSYADTIEGALDSARALADALLAERIDDRETDTARAEVTS